MTGEDAAQHGTSTNPALLELQRLKDFVYNAKVFIRDLQVFGQDKSAQNRLNATNDQFYLGAPYFTKGMAECILALPLGGSTLLDKLQTMAKETIEAGEMLCSSHGFAPVYEEAFEMQYADFRDQTFKGLEHLTPAGPVDELSPMPSTAGHGKQTGKKGLRK